MSLRIKTTVYKKNILLFFLILAFWGGAYHVSAFTLDPQYVTRSSGGVVSVASDFYPAVQLFIFRADTGAWIANTDTADITITDADWDGSTNFWIVPVSPDSNGWGDCATTFEACILDEVHYISSVGYQGLYYVPEGGGPAAVPDEGGSGYHVSSNSTPQITILSPQKGSVFSHKGLVKYESVDRDDTGNDVEKLQGGMANNPVSLFYSDKVDAQNYTFVDPLFKFSIASDLPAIGEYVWSIKDLVPGVIYRVIANIIDRGGLQGEAISDFFTVDYTPPVFIVTANPPAVRKGDVVISVDASEDLLNVPQVTVTQRGGSALPVVMLGEGTHFEGVYKVVSGYDGLATISVIGNDNAGNVSTTTVSGSSFSVGVNPPTAPIITSPLQKSVVQTDSVDIEGYTREDTEIIVLVNGVERTTVKPNTDGFFKVSKVILEKVKNQGRNYISVVARDLFNVIGEASVLEVKQNIPPTVSLVSPKNNSLVSDTGLLNAQGFDPNGDTLFYTYQIAPFKNTGKLIPESLWSPLGETVPASGFTWSATDVDDGEYSIRVIADDGIAKASSTPTHITVRNTLPFLRFEDGRKTVTTDNVVTLYAQAISSNNLATRSAIKKVEYSLDRGSKWTTVKLTNTGTIYERKFFVTLPSLKEGTYPLLWKITDERGLEGRATHVVVIDKTSPESPAVSFPRGNVVITDQNDENSYLSGTQISLTGTAEPGSQVVLTYGGQYFKAKSSINGIFSFKDFSFLKRGRQDITLYALDEAGNKSAATSISFTYNNPPRIAFISPKPFHGLSNQSNIKWKITDSDNDIPYDTVLSYRRFGGVYKNILKNADPEGTFAWSVSDLPEANDYELKITTTDGLTPVSSVQSFSVDRTAPRMVSLYTKEQLKKGEKFSATGAVSDNSAGIEFVEYAIQSEYSPEERKWYKAVITDGFVQNYAAYAIHHPVELEDGTYILFVRAVDSAGNISAEMVRPMKIDKTAPRIGIYFIDVKGIKIVPDDTNTLFLPEMTSFTFNVSLESDTLSAQLKLFDRDYDLKKDFSTGLWTTNIMTDSATTTGFGIYAVDGSGNDLSNTSLGSLSVFKRGDITYLNDAGVRIPISGALIRVLVWNKDMKAFKPYVSHFAEIFDTTDSNGYYGGVLPQGLYRLVVTKYGYKTIHSDITMDRNGFIHTSFTTTPVSGFSGWMDAIINWLYY